jgi:hypothetical protein
MTNPGRNLASPNYQVFQKNNYTLSKIRCDSHFQWMTDDEVRRAQQEVVEAFGEILKINGNSNE